MLQTAATSFLPPVERDFVGATTQQAAQRWWRTVQGDGRLQVGGVGHRQVGPLGHVDLATGQPGDDRRGKERLGPGFGAGGDAGVVGFGVAGGFLPSDEVVVRLALNAPQRDPFANKVAPAPVGDFLCLPLQHILHVLKPIGVKGAMLQPVTRQARVAFAIVTHRQAGHPAEGRQQRLEQAQVLRSEGVSGQQIEVDAARVLVVSGRRQAHPHHFAQDEL